MSYFRNKTGKKAVLIIAGNLIPLVGVVFFNWKVKEILFFFLLEYIFVELINTVKIAVLTFAGEKQKASSGSAYFAAVLMVAFHLAIFLLGLLFLLVITVTAAGYGADSTAVGNPLAPIADFLKSSYLAIILLLTDRVRDFIFSFYKNQKFKQIKSSRYFKLSILRQSTILGASIFFAFLFRDGISEPLLFLCLVLTLKSIAELYIGDGR